MVQAHTHTVDVVVTPPGVFFYSCETSMYELKDYASGASLGWPEHAFWRSEPSPVFFAWTMTKCPLHSNGRGDGVVEEDLEGGGL